MSQMGPPSMFQGIQGDLGSFMSPNFVNPALRVPQGFSDYFGMSPNQRVFGGAPLGSLGWSGPVQMPQAGGSGLDPWGGGGGQGPGGWGGNLDMSGRAPLGVPGGSPTGGQGGPQMPGAWQTPETGTNLSWGGPSPGWNPWSGGGPTGVRSWNDRGWGGPATGQPDFWSPQGLQTQPGAAPAASPTMAGGGISDPTGGLNPAQRALAGLPQLSAYMPGGSSGFSGGGNYDTGTAQGMTGNLLSQAGFGAPGVAQGAKSAWNMGAGANMGQMRTNPQTGQPEIYMGSGQGGESYAWQPFDAGNYGQVQNAEMFTRYGPNWGAGGTGAPGHFGDLSAISGQTLNPQQEYDYRYGVTPYTGPGGAGAPPSTAPAPGAPTPTGGQGSVAPPFTPTTKPATATGGFGAPPVPGMGVGLSGLPVSGFNADDFMRRQMENARQAQQGGAQPLAPGMGSGSQYRPPNTYQQPIPQPTPGGPPTATM